MAPQPRLHPLHRNPVRTLHILPKVTLPHVLHAPPRYSCIAVLLLSNIGYFANFFDACSCHQYFIAAPVLKGMYFFQLCAPSLAVCGVRAEDSGGGLRGLLRQEGVRGPGADMITAVVQTTVSQIILGIRYVSSVTRMSPASRAQRASIIER